MSQKESKTLNGLTERIIAFIQTTEKLQLLKKNYSCLIWKNEIEEVVKGLKSQQNEYSQSNKNF